MRTYALRRSANRVLLRYARCFQLVKATATARAIETTKEFYMPATVNTERCDGCKTCEENCPNGSVVVTNGHAFVNKDECIECAACVSDCVRGAITMAD